MLLLVRVLNLANICCTILDLTNWRSPVPPKSVEKIGVAAAEMLIPSTLELGGKSANIFFDDMPFDKALEGAQKGILFNQGQVCCAGSRIFVQESVYDKLSRH